MSAWLRRALVLLVPVLGGCQCASLNPAVVYRCEQDGGCFVAGHICAAVGDPDEGWCVPADAGAGGGGGGVGGGGVGGGGVGGGAGGGSTDGGACVPTQTCASAPTPCAEVNDGCGRILRCDNCPGASFCDLNGACGNQVCTFGGWCWENPFPQGATLVDAWAAAPDDVWAVGDRGALLRFDGKGWAAYWSGTQVTFNAVHGNRRDNVFAVGYSGTIVHWDGTGWSLEPITPALPSVVLWGVWAGPGGTAWAAGDGVVLRRQPLTKTWVNDNAPGTTPVYEECWGTSADDVWAIGDTALAHRVDGGWQAVALPGLQGSEQLWHVWGPGDGTMYASDRGGALAFYDGTQWTLTRPFGLNVDIHHLWGSGPADVWAAGPTALFHKGTGGWSPATSPVGNSGLRGGVSIDAGVAIVVGERGAWAITAPNGTGVTSYADTIGAGLAVHAIDRDRVVVTGRSGLWYERTSDGGRARWEQHTCGSAFTGSMQAVWGSPSGKLFATSAAAQVVRFAFGSNNQCTVTAAPFDGGAVWGQPNGPIVFGGRGGSAWFADESAGAPLRPLPTAPDGGAHLITGVWGDPFGQFWASTRGGNNGGLWKVSDLDAGWTWALLPTANALRAIHGASDGTTTEALAVGDDSRSLYANAGWPMAAFATPAGGAGEPLRSVHVVRPGLAWGAGLFGGSLKWNGTGWSTVATPIDSIASVTGAPDGGVWLLGSGTYDTSVLWRP